MDKESAIRCGAIVKLLYHDNGDIENPNFANIYQLLGNKSGSFSQFKDDMHDLDVNGIINSSASYGTDVNEETTFEISDIAWLGITFFLSSNYRSLLEFNEQKETLDEVFSYGDYR